MAEPMPGEVEPAHGKGVPGSPVGIRLGLPPDAQQPEAAGCIADDGGELAGGMRGAKGEAPVVGGGLHRGRRAAITVPDVVPLKIQYAAVSSTLTERGRRLWAAAEARSLGRGGIKLVAEVTGLSRRTVERGIKELKAPVARAQKVALAAQASRRPGAGRKRLGVKYPKLLVDLNGLVDPATRGHPQSALRWSAKSTGKLAAQLQELGHQVSERSVAGILKAQGYSLQAMRKTKEGGLHEDRNAQFEHIASRVREFQCQGQPVVSIDAKKKELVGTYANKGREWQPKGHPEQANVYDFVDKELGKVTPYGVYDLQHNVGWVSVGIDHDTAEFAVQTLRRWWAEMGQALYP